MGVERTTIDESGKFSTTLFDSQYKVILYLMGATFFFRHYSSRLPGAPTCSIPFFVGKDLLPDDR